MNYEFKKKSDNFSVQRSAFSVQKGFTLLELLVITTIIILLTTFSLANFRGGEKQFALKRSLHKLSQDLRMAEEMAMSARKFHGKVPGGYGIFFEKDRQAYILFADCNKNGAYDGSDLVCPDCSVTPCSEGAFPEKVEELSLEEGIKIANFSPDSSALTITFFPPDPTVKIFDEDFAEASFASIFLTANGQSKEVFINTIGLIDID